jgi:hypothetical protein
MLSQSSLCWEGVAQPKSGEDKTVYHLGKADSELKLTNFQEKSSGPRSTLAPRLTLQAVEIGNCSHNSYGLSKMPMTFITETEEINPKINLEAPKTTNSQGKSEQKKQHWKYHNI